MVLICIYSNPQKTHDGEALSVGLGPVVSRRQEQARCRGSGLSGQNMKALRGQVGRAGVEELRGRDITASKPAVFPGPGICPHICRRGRVRPLTVQCRASLHKHRPGPDEWANHRDWCSQLWGQEPMPKVSQGRALSRVRTPGEGPSCPFPPLGAPASLGFWPHHPSLCLHRHVASPCVSVPTFS